MLLFRPDLEDDKLQAAVEKVTRAIVNAGGTLTKVSPWGKRRLAYDIQHFREASYFLLHFDIAPDAIRELERGMLISEEILRHLVTVLEDRGAADEELAPAAVSPDMVDIHAPGDQPDIAAELDSEPEPSEPEVTEAEASPAEASQPDETDADEAGAVEPEAESARA
jgi:small subunit ribosomal protein S6